MAILHPVGVGTILRCDYSRGGFQEPEMVKARPAVVISPRLPHRDGLCAVVPLSITPPPKDDLKYVVRLEIEPLPEPYGDPIVWAKCDMVATVSFSRLDMFRTARDQFGKRKYLHPKLSPEDLARIKLGILWGLGLAT